MKKQLIILGLALSSCCSFSEVEVPPPSQELEPIESGFTYHTPLYFINLRHVLFENTDSNASDPFARLTLPENDFQFLVLPSFEPEILLTVRKGDTNYIATISKPEKQVWSFGGNIKDLRTTEKRKEIAADLAVRCDGLWKQMLIRVQFQKAWVEPDGQSYCFFKYFKGAGTVAGMTHAKPNSKPSMLAGVGLGLIQYVDAPPEKEAVILNSLNSRIERLEKALETKTSIGIGTPLAERSSHTNDRADRVTSGLAAYQGVVMYNIFNLFLVGVLTYALACFVKGKKRNGLIALAFLAVIIVLLSLWALFLLSVAKDR